MSGWSKPGTLPFASRLSDLCASAGRGPSRKRRFGSSTTNRAWRCSTTGSIKPSSPKRWKNSTPICVVEQGGQTVWSDLLGELEREMEEARVDKTRTMLLQYLQHSH